MFIDSLPGLKEDGMLATFRRALALDREDLEFLSPDHQLVDGTLSMLLDGAQGLELHRYLAPTPLLVTVDLAGRPWEGELPPPHRLERLLAPTVAALTARLGDRLEALVERAEREAITRAAPLAAAALAEAGSRLREEQDRFEELRRVNPAVSAREVQSHRSRMGAVLKALQEASPRLDALRLVLMETSPA